MTHAANTLYRKAVRTLTARRRTRGRLGCTIAGLTAMLLPALLPTSALVLCVAADGSLSLEAAHVRGSCAHNVANHEEHEGHHHEAQHEHDHDAAPVADGACETLEQLVDHEHGCSDRNVDLDVTTVSQASPVRILRSGWSHCGAALRPTPTRVVTAARGPPPQDYFTRTVVMVI